MKTIGVSGCQTVGYCRASLQFIHMGLKVFRGITLLTLGVVLLVGCQPIVSMMASNLNKDLSDAILMNPDVDIVNDAIPAYILLIDAFLRSNPKSVALLQAASTLNGSYSTAFVRDKERQKLLAGKSRRLAMEGACYHRKLLCDLEEMPFPQFASNIEMMKGKDIATLYNLASGWALWIQANTDDWLAVAQLAKVKLIMARVMELDETYDHGSVHMYMGVFESLLPASLGGRPEEAKKHFERAVEISNEMNLYAKVLYAEKYARLVFNRDLHDQLLTEVINADAEAGTLTLQNQIAKNMAEELLSSAEDYF